MYFRLFIATIFLLQGTLCPSLCRAGVYDAVANADNAAVQSCHDMSENASSVEKTESAVVADNSRLSPEDLEKLKRLQEDQKSQVKKEGQQDQPAQDKPVNEKKTKSPCCGDGEILITHSSARVDDLGFGSVDLPVHVPIVTLLPISTTVVPAPVLAQGQYRATRDLRILYSSFLI